MNARTESSDVCGVNVRPESCSYQPLPFTDETESFFRPKFFRLAVKLFRLSFVGVGIASPEAGEAGPLRSTSLSSTDCESSTITTSFCIESSTVPEIPPPRRQDGSEPPLPQLLTQRLLHVSKLESHRPTSLRTQRRWPQPQLGWELLVTLV